MKPSRLVHIGLSWLLLVLPVAACTVSSASDGSSDRALILTAPKGQPLLQWPSSSPDPRIAFVQSISTASDVQISKNFFQKAMDWIFGAEDLRLQRPGSVLVVDGVIYIGDIGLKGIHRLNQGRACHGVIYGPDGQWLPSPVGLARGPGQTVFVADSALAQVLTIGPEETSAVIFPLTKPVKQPTGIAYSKVRNELYVSDTAAHQIEVYDGKGQWLRSLGTRGKENGEFNFPTYLALTAEGNLVVTDALNFRIQVLTPEGRFIRAFGRQGDGSGDLGRHKGLAIDALKHLYVADGLFSAVQIFDLDGNFLLTLGSLGRGNGEFWLPMGIHVDEQQRIYVADSANQRVQILQYVGASR